MVDTMARKQRSDAPFIAELEAANFHPVWDRFKKITPLRPQAAVPTIVMTAMIPFHIRRPAGLKSCATPVTVIDQQD